MITLQNVDFFVQVNIDYKMRENIVDQLKTNDASIFTEAQHQIYSLMYRDSYPRFLSSVFVVELIEEVNGETKSFLLNIFNHFYRV